METNIPEKSHKNLIIFSLVGLILFTLIIAGLFILGDKAEKNEDFALLPSNTCPDSFEEVNGRMQAIYKGDNYDLSEEDYNWVLKNCNDDNTVIVEEFDELYLAPKLSNLGVSLARYDVNTGRAGSIVFNNDNLASNWPGNKIFFEFGTMLPGNKQSPEIAYTQLDLDTDIMAMADGKVVEVQDQTSESNDYALGILFSDEWILIYDHLTNLTVEMGDSVSAGDILGKPSVNKDGITGYTEIQLKHVDKETNVQNNYCPLAYLDTELMSDYEALFSSLMNDWETLVGDTSIYNESDMVIPGCSVLSYTE